MIQILVVEDNTALRSLTERILRTHGYTVLGAANGTQARRIAEAHAGDIAVMLTDVVMPDHSGPALAESIRAYRPATKVVFMSGYTAHHDRAAGNGAVRLLPGPDVGHRQPVVRIRGGFLRDVDDDGRSDELPDGDLVRGAPASREVNRRVEVSSAVLGRAEGVG